MSQTKNHCEPLVAVWLRPSTMEPCICCKQVAEKPRGEHLKMMYVCIAEPLTVTKHQPSVLFMSFFVIPREIREINKPGGGVKISCGGSAKITKKINVSPRFILNLRVGAGVENCVQDKTEQHFNIPCIFKNSTQKNFFIILFSNLVFSIFYNKGVL